MSPIYLFNEFPPYWQILNAVSAFLLWKCYIYGCTCIHMFIYHFTDILWLISSSGSVRFLKVRCLSHKVSYSQNLRAAVKLPGPEHCTVLYSQRHCTNIYPTLHFCWHWLRSISKIGSNPYPVVLFGFSLITSEFEQLFKFLIIVSVFTVLANLWILFAYYCIVFPFSNL